MKSDWRGESAEDELAIRVSSSHGFVLVRGWNIQGISHARSTA